MPRVAFALSAWAMIVGVGCGSGCDDCLVGDPEESLAIVFSDHDLDAERVQVCWFTCAEVPYEPGPVQSFPIAELGPDWETGNLFIRAISAEGGVIAVIVGAPSSVETCCGTTWVATEA